MPDYMRPSTEEVEATIDKMLEYIGDDFDRELGVFRPMLIGEIEGLLDGMYQIPSASSEIRDGMNANTSLTLEQCEEATNWIYQHVFNKEG